MNGRSYQCPKCGGRNAEMDQIRTTGSVFSKFFNIQNRRFTTVSCTQCGYTEFYRNGKSSGLRNVIDFLGN